MSVTPGAPSAPTSLEASDPGASDAIHPFQSQSESQNEASLDPRYVVHVADASEYEKAMPWLQEQAARYMKTLAEVRATHGGRPAAEVKAALLAAGERHGVRIANEVAQDAAGRIADGTL